MPTVNEIKDQATLPTPLLLFECRLANGRTERWSTHQIQHGGFPYEARVVQHSALEQRQGLDDGADGAAELRLTLANADAYFSQVERNEGFKGASLTARLGFFDVETGTALSELETVFLGLGDSPELVSEDAVRVRFLNRLNLANVVLPRVRVQSRCPWVFPGNATQRSAAVDGGLEGCYDPFYHCGYSPDAAGGKGNLDGGAAFTSCNATKSDCVARGMYREDSAQRKTARFGGFQFLPPSILVRGHNEKGQHASPVLDNRAMRNDAVPLVYGTVWMSPALVVSRNDGNLTHCEFLLGSGPIEGVVKVFVNDTEIPAAAQGADMSGSGWYKLLSNGEREGEFNPSFTDGSGQPIGDPHGGQAVLGVVVPNRLNDGTRLPQVRVLLNGMKLPRFDPQGSFAGTSFTRNPAWVVLDLLRRSGWRLSELDLSSFAQAAAHCDVLIPMKDVYGVTRQAPRFEVNFALQRRQRAAEVIRGVRLAAALTLTFSAGGTLRLAAERTLAGQHAAKPAGSNAVAALSGGWPAYEFGDGSYGSTGILRDQNGAPTLRLWSRAASDSPNRLTVEFQDGLNDYQQESLSLVEVDDALRSGGEHTAVYPAWGIANANQALRLLRFQLLKRTQGNRYAEFETSVRGISLRPGDLITLTSEREGLNRAPFRVLRTAPSLNCESVRLTVQKHDDAWYTLLEGDDTGGGGTRRREEAGSGAPRPLGGTITIGEKLLSGTNGSRVFELSARYVKPRREEALGLGIPMVSLSPAISNSGTLAGGKTFYYAVTARDAAGSESAPSLLVRAVLAGGGSDYAVTLEGLSFDPETAGWSLYRGSSPDQLRLVTYGSGRPLTIVDTGFAEGQESLPDRNYDHANFYWRFERMPQTQVAAATDSTIRGVGLNLQADELKDAAVRITEGKGAGQERLVAGNTADTVTTAAPWSVVPDATSKFAVADAMWQYTGAARGEEAVFHVPYRPGMTVQVMGRAANAQDVEASEEASPVARWQLGVGGAGLDSDVPGMPYFGLGPLQAGTLELAGISFASLENTHTIESATLSLHYWDEGDSPTPQALTAKVAQNATEILIAPALSVGLNDYLQIDREILRVLDALDGGARLQVERGYAGTAAVEHGSGEAVFRLKRKTVVVPFPPDFFGSPVSGSFSYPIAVGDSRIAFASLYVTNSIGESPTRRVAATGTVDHGLRVLSGGQYTIQVDGELSIAAQAAPPLIVDAKRAVRDMFAQVMTAPVGAPAVIRLKQDGVEIAEFTIPAGQARSNTVDGFGRASLLNGALLTIDVVSVGQGAGSAPGSDLTVMLRF